MLTKEDKKWITTNFATKSDLKLLATKKELTGIEIDIAILRGDVKDVKKSYSRMETKVDEVLTKLDKFVGNIADIDQENKFGAVTLHRHDIQIHELATATGTAISD